MRYLWIIVLILVGIMPAISDNPPITTESSIIAGTNKFYTNIFAGEPSYALEILNNHITPDGNYTLELSISGAGTVLSSDNISNSKLEVVVPREIIQDSRIYTQMVKFDENGKAYLENKTWNIPAIWLAPPKEYYEIQNKSGLANGLTNYGEVLWYASPNEIYPTVNIKFKLLHNAAGGDHIIYVNMFFKDATNGWHADKEVVPVHIKYWYENEMYSGLLYLLRL